MNFTTKLYCAALTFMTLIFAGTASVCVSAKDYTTYLTLNTGQVQHFDCSECIDAAFISSNPHVADFDRLTHNLISNATGYTNISTICPLHGRKYYRIHVTFPVLTLNKYSATIYSGTKKGNTVQLRAKKQIGANNTIEWTTSDESIATVSSSGKVTARGPGDVTITATSNGLSSACSVHVCQAELILPFQSITLSTKGKGCSYKITPTIIGPKSKIIWKSSNKKIATVSGGTIVGRSTGNATISITANGLTKNINVDVGSSLCLNKKSLTLYVGDPKPTILKAYTKNKIINGEWSSDNDSIVSVNNGMLTPISPGTTTVSCIYEDHIDSCIVTVKNRELILNRNELYLDSKGPNSAFKLSAKVLDSSSGKITWSTSDASIALVNKSGKITAKKPGVALITATYKDLSSVCTVNISETTLDCIPDNIILDDLGATYKLSPLYLGTSDEVFYTSSNTNVATVSSNGTINGCAKGHAIITIHANGLTAKCKVTVNSIETVLSKEVIGLNTVNHTFESLKAKVIGPSDSIIWSSSNENVATVSPKGIVSAVSTGSAIITARANEKEDTCTVCVTDASEIMPSARISIDTGSLTLNLRGTNTSSLINATAFDTKEPIVWYSTKPSVASVTQDGLVRAVNKGTTTIVACIGNKRAKCKVKVINNTIKLKKNLFNLDVNSTKKCKVKLNPVITGVTKDVYYETSNENVIRIKGNIIYAVDEGSAKITITSNGISALCYVNVTNENHMHNFEDTTINSPTCTESGLTEHTCISCNERFLESVAMTGHKWNSGIITTSPTCEEVGIRTFTCMNDGCNKTLLSSVMPLGHNMDSEYTIDIFPNCIESGLKSHHCTRDNCDYISDPTSISPNGHAYITIISSCNGIDNGYKYDKCEDCEAIINEQYYVHVTGDNVTLTSSDYWNKGSDVILSATPEYGYDFIGWMIDETFVSDSASYTLSNIDCAVTVTAVTTPKIVTAIATDCNTTYDGQGHSISVIPTPADSIISYSTDNITFTSAPIQFENTGNYIVYYKAEKESYRTAYGSATICIKPQNIDNASIATLDTQVYTGDSVTPTPTITCDGKSLILGTDFNCNYTNNIDVGTATVVISGTGNYTGNIHTTFEISKINTNLAQGRVVNSTIKKVAGSGTEIYSTDEHITAINIVRTNLLPSGPAIDNSGRTSVVYNSDTGIVTIYCNATNLMANVDSSYMFSNLNNVSTISGFDIIDTSRTDNMMNMFAGTGKNADTFYLDLSTLNTGNAFHLSNMFSSTALFSKKVTIIIPSMSHGCYMNTSKRIYGIWYIGEDPCYAECPSSHPFTLISK